MMRFFAILIFMTASFVHVAKGADNSSEVAAALNLHNAIAVCHVPNNPLYNGVYKLGGHILTHETRKEYQNANNEWEVLMTANVLWSPRIFNTAIRAPDRLLGEVKLVMGYNQGHLFCNLTVKPIEWQ